MKTKKKEKKKLSFATILLILFLTIILLITSTYAWFTANKTVTIDSINIKVASTSGLEISSNGIDWKNILSNAEIINPTNYNNHINQFPPILKPVSSDGKVDTNGKMNVYYGEITSNPTTGDYIVSSIKQTDTKGQEGHYVAFDIFLKIEQDSPIYLTTDSNVIVMEDEIDKGLQNSSRIAFVMQGDEALDAAPVTVQNTRNLVNNKNVYIWEPNSNIHNTSAASQISLYGATINDKTSTDGVARGATTYYGLSREFSDIDMKSLMLGTNGTLGNYISTMESSANGVKLLTTSQDFRTYQELFSIRRGITKIRVYLWIEGQDIDNENSVSGSGISYNIHLSKVPSETGN